jgi:glutathione S-transferase
MPTNTIPTLYGAPYSVYVRAVRLTLEEKVVSYELVPIDIFASEGALPDHKARHPFGKIPAFEHAGFQLYEAGAITRYVDEAFPGPRLQPEHPHGRARMNQIISILDSYAYRTLVWDIYVERVSRPDDRSFPTGSRGLSSSHCARSADEMVGSSKLAAEFLAHSDAAAPRLACSRTRRVGRRQRLTSVRTV